MTTLATDTKTVETIEKKMPQKIRQMEYMFSNVCKYFKIEKNIQVWLFVYNLIFFKIGKISKFGYMFLFCFYIWNPFKVGKISKFGSVCILGHKFWPIQLIPTQSGTPKMIPCPEEGMLTS
jgi:hypothetical protein